MDFDGLLDQAWTDHASDAADVAERLAEPGLDLLRQAADVAQLAHLAQHVHGQHLGRWAEGVAFQQRLAALPLLPAGDPTAQAVARYTAALQLAGGLAAIDIGGSEGARRAALAAAALAAHDPPRARTLLEHAAGIADTLPDDDPAVRAVAVAGNNIAATLEEEPGYGEALRPLMIGAAETARAHWARAGTGLETERAEYRLARCWLRAGDPARALHHARLCLRIVHEIDGPALERFFGLEVLALAQRASGDRAGWQASCELARRAYAALDAADKALCRPTLERLEDASALPPH